MFERFTDRARQVAVDAQAAARRLGHGYVGTEHLLLGLLQGDGLAARVLGGLGITAAAVEHEVLAEVGRGPLGPGDAEALGAIGIDLDEVRRRVEASFGPGALSWHPGPRCRRWNNRFPVGGHIPFSPRAKKVLELSLREALALKHNYIGTEHILLGLVREGEGVAAQVLVKLGADLSRVRQQVIQLLSGYGGGEAAAEPAGARTRLVRMTVPEELREAEEQLAQVRREKEAAIDTEDFERAAALRDRERELLERVAERERAWTAGVDLAAVIQENQNLHREVERLRELLGRHGIEPEGGTTETA